MSKQKKSFESYATEQVRRIRILKDMGYTTDQAINLMTCFGLEGILDTLRSPEFQCAADGLGALGECVSTDMCGSRFCVTGDVTSYEP